MKGLNLSKGVCWFKKSGASPKSRHMLSELELIDLAWLIDSWDVPCNSGDVPKKSGDVNCKIRGCPLEIRGYPRKIRGGLLEIMGCPLNIRGCPLEIRGCPLQIRGCPLQIRACPMEIRGCPLDIRGCDHEIEIRPKLTQKLILPRIDEIKSFLKLNFKWKRPKNLFLRQKLTFW